MPLVVSPLASLIHDQISQLDSAGVDCAMLIGEADPAAQQAVIATLYGMQRGVPRHQVNEESYKVAPGQRRYV